IFSHNVATVPLSLVTPTTGGQEVLLTNAKAGFDHLIISKPWNN
ncbi:hypothetical protein AVEN_135924-1, partial [Araneus ventricosus]